MGRGRGKGKKSIIASREDPGSGEEEKIPAQKKRGRPQKPLKDEIDDEEVGVGQIDEDDNNDNKSTLDSSKDLSTTTALETPKKRKRNSTVKEKSSSVSEENGVAPSLVADISAKPNIGFRHIGSRRKSKPRRAAEVGVECW